MVDNNIHNTRCRGQQFTQYRQWWRKIYTIQTVLEKNLHNTDIGGQQNTQYRHWWRKLHSTDSGGQQYTQYSQWWTIIYTIQLVVDNNLNSDEQQYTQC